MKLYFCSVKFFGNSESMSKMAVRGRSRPHYYDRTTSIGQHNLPEMVFGGYHDPLPIVSPQPSEQFDDATYDRWATSTFTECDDLLLMSEAEIL